MAPVCMWQQVQSNGESLDVLSATPGSSKRDVSHTFAYDKAFHPREGQVAIVHERERVRDRERERELVRRLCFKEGVHFVKEIQKGSDRRRPPPVLCSPFFNLFFPAPLHTLFAGPCV